jgi:hypothetical protein
MQSILKVIGVVILCALAFKALIILLHVMGMALGVVCTVIWVGALLHILFNETLPTMSKVIWFAVVFFTHVVGAVLYFLFGRRVLA